MPDNENIKYSYELDISSLQKGTEKAVTLLQKQIDGAKNARDRLLPKLMNGEIEI